MESGVRWFKEASGEPFQFQWWPRGIKVPRLAAKVQLKDSTLELNGVVVDPDEHGYISLKEAAGFIGELGQSADNPIPVSGQPAAPPAAGEPAPVTAPAQKSGFKDLEDKFEDWFNTAVRKGLTYWHAPGPEQQTTRYKKIA